jgi:hypothetical protein
LTDGSPSTQVPPTVVHLRPLAGPLRMGFVFPPQSAAWVLAFCAGTLSRRPAWAVLSATWLFPGLLTLTYPPGGGGRRRDDSDQSCMSMTTLTSSG